MGIGFAFKAAAALAVLLALVAVPICSDESDAEAPEYSGEITIDLNEYAFIDVYQFTDGDTYASCAWDKTSGDISLPPGMSKDNNIISGTPTEIGEYILTFRFSHSTGVWLIADGYLSLKIYVEDLPETYTVTYDAGIGIVNGSVKWSETIVEGTFASMPDARYTSGAYTFKGWSLYETSSDTIDSLKVTSDVTLYAVWERNTVSVSPITATISNGQTSNIPVSTDPEDARLSISDLGGLSSQNAKVSGRYLILDMTGVQPGTYYITLSASYTGYYTGSAKVTVMVPITIVEPIEYTLSEGDVFSYTPVTNPSNASIELKSVLLDGSPLADSGLSVKGRTITGTLSQSGTYEIAYRAFLDGYVDVSSTVVVYVSPASESPSGGSVSLASVTAASRASEPRVFDFIAIGGQNVSNYVWTVDGEVFSTSSPTALYEFPSAGVYTVGCTARGFDGSEATIEITVVCTDNYHREAAWSGVEYGYIVEGDVQAVLPGDGPFVRSTETIDGRTFTMVSGTPSEADIGKVFELFVGDDSWTVTVYRAESSAPTASFEVSVDGYSVSAGFTGLNASFHMFDFDGDGTYEDGSEFTYGAPGRYSIVCCAVNNISEVKSTVYVEIDIVPQEDTTLEELTDFEMGVGERMYISIALADSDVLSVSGTASDFVTVEGHSLRAAPDEAGVFGLTVTVTHADGSTSDKTVEVTVRQPGTPAPEPDSGDYTVAMILIFVVSVALIAGFLVYDTRTGKVSGKYRSLKARAGARVRGNGSTGRYSHSQNSRQNGGRRR